MVSIMDSRGRSPKLSWAQAYSLVLYGEFWSINLLFLSLYKCRTVEGSELASIRQRHVTSTMSSWYSNKQTVVLFASCLATGSFVAIDFDVTNRSLLVSMSFSFWRSCHRSIRNKLVDMTIPIVTPKYIQPSWLMLIVFHFQPVCDLRLTLYILHEICNDHNILATKSDIYVAACPEDWQLYRQSLHVMWSSNK